MNQNQNRTLEGAMPELRDGHFMFFVGETMRTEHGYRPSIIVEDLPGHYPNGGGDTEPWYWGHDLAVARKIAHDRNAAMGLSSEDEARILLSSMRRPSAVGSPSDSPPICECDNCRWAGHADELRSIGNLAERVTPGGIAPAGECPECGALAYADRELEARAEAVQAAHDNPDELDRAEEEAQQAEPATPSPVEASDAANVTVVIEIEGGVVQMIYSTEPLTAFLVIDRGRTDMDGEEAARIREIEVLVEDPQFTVIRA